MSKRGVVKASPVSAADFADDAAPNRAIGSQQPAPGNDLPPTEAAGDLRWQLIAAAAYYRAEQRRFALGCELEDWVAAEAQIYAQLSTAPK